MKRFFLLSLFILVSSLLSLAKQVEFERAKNVAATFINSVEDTNLKSIHTTDLIPVKIKYPSVELTLFSKSSKIDDNQLVYLFKTNTDGFVIVSGDDKANAILAYSLTSKLDEADLPVNFLKWIDEYKKQLHYLKNSPNYSKTNIGNDWLALENANGVTTTANIEAVGPLMTTQWNQAPYYNDLCPQEFWLSEKAVTGCVATAMAQIMKYHNFPIKGSGIHSYYHTNNTITYGNLSANFGATTYDWNNMPDRLSASSSSTQVNAVATLMLHCGVGVDMDYSPNTSGAWVVESKGSDESSAEYAFKEYFNYNKSSVKALFRDDMSQAEWIQALNTELENGRPVMFAGVGDGGGHAFVADGFDNNNYYHMNWGWGGNSDGYYQINAFDPVDLGTGAGNGSYNWDQRVVIGIEPPQSEEEDDLSLYSAITVPEIYQLQAFQIDLEIVNNGQTTFTGELGAALFNEDGDFVEFIETFDTESSLESGYYWSGIWFSSEGLSAYPGNYIIGIYYKPVGGNWIALGDGDYENFIEIEILSPFGDSDIKLYDSIHASPSPLITGQSILIETQLANYSTSKYNGQLGAGLFTLDGELAQEIEVITDIELDAENYYDVWFENQSVDVEPGAYLLGLVHFPDNSDDQIVIAPNGYHNPVEVNVTIPNLVADIYENNNEVNSAYSVLLDFQNDFSGFTTEGSNLHSETDVDYYRIALPDGYKYTIWARAYDSYNAEANEDYTCDVIWAHTINSDWSEFYDDEMDDPFVVYGGVYYFGIVSYFQGQTGTYNLGVDIVREESNAVNDQTDLDEIKIYPNPVKEKLFVNSENVIDSYEIIDHIGATVLTAEIEKSNFDIDVSCLLSGIYFLKLNNKNCIETQKIVIHE